MPVKVVMVGIMVDVVTLEGERMGTLEYIVITRKSKKRRRSSKHPLSRSNREDSGENSSTRTSWTREE